MAEKVQNQILDLTLPKKSFSFQLQQDSLEHFNSKIKLLIKQEIILLKIHIYKISDLD